jgi:hypothetical protein
MSPSRFGALRALGLLPLGHLWATGCGDVTSDVIVRDVEAPSGCSADGECGAATPRCELTSGRCVACLQALDCPDGQTCALPAGSCVLSCLAADVCDDERPICDATGLCRGCLVDDECPTTAPRCDPAGACLACLDASDCSPGSDTPFCASGRCVECTSDGHCDDDDERCSLVLGVCATPCSPAQACNPDDPICDTDIGFCVECRDDLDCEDDERCRASECEDEDEDEDDDD